MIIPGSVANLSLVSFEHHQVRDFTSALDTPFSYIILERVHIQPGEIQYHEVVQEE